MTMRYVSLTPDGLRKEYLVANRRARSRYAELPDAPVAAAEEKRNAAEAIDDVIRQVRRDAINLASEAEKARARRAARELRSLRDLLGDLGL